MPNKHLFQALSSIKYGESLASVLHSVQQMQNSPSLILERTRNKYWFSINFKLNAFSFISSLFQYQVCRFLHPVLHLQEVTNTFHTWIKQMNASWLSLNPNDCKNKKKPFWLWRGLNNMKDYVGQMAFKNTSPLLIKLYYLLCL